MQHLKSKAIVDKYVRNIKRLAGKTQNSVVIDSPDSKDDEKPFGGMTSSLFGGESLDDSLVDMEDSDEECLDSLPLSKFQPDIVENDIDTRDMGTLDPLRLVLLGTGPTHHRRSKNEFSLLACN